jgi:hypothetical protein
MTQDKKTQIGKEVGFDPAEIYRNLESKLILENNPIKSIHLLDFSQREIGARMKKIDLSKIAEGQIQLYLAMSGCSSDHGYRHDNNGVGVGICIGTITKGKEEYVMNWDWKIDEFYDPSQKEGYLTMVEYIRSGTKG